MKYFPGEYFAFPVTEPISIVQEPFLIENVQQKYSGIAPGCQEKNIKPEIYRSFFGKKASLIQITMLHLNHSDQSNRIGAKQVDAIATTCQESLSFVLALNERCPMVRAFSRLVQWWDRDHKFTFVDMNSSSHIAAKLRRDLDKSPWSVLLTDDSGNKWYGPEAVPIILTHLPFGKLAAVAYLLPGTMWLTRSVYRLFSRNRQHFSAPQKAV